MAFVFSILSSSRFEVRINCCRKRCVTTVFMLAPFNSHAHPTCISTCTLAKHCIEWVFFASEKCLKNSSLWKNMWKFTKCTIFHWRHLPTYKSDAVFQHDFFLQHFLMNIFLNYSEICLHWHRNEVIPFKIHVEFRRRNYCKHLVKKFWDEFREAHSEFNFRNEESNCMLLQRRIMFTKHRNPSKLKPKTNGTNRENYMFSATSWKKASEQIVPDIQVHKMNCK